LDSFRIFLIFGIPRKPSFFVAAIKKGVTIKTGVDYNELTNRPTHFTDVKPQNTDEYFGIGLLFNKTYNEAKDFKAIQLIACDKEGRFPWDTEYEEDSKTIQPLLNT